MSEVECEDEGSVFRGGFLALLPRPAQARPHPLWSNKCDISISLVPGLGIEPRELRLCALTDAGSLKVGRE